MLTAVQELPREQRHPADYRDDLEHAEVAAIVSELPDDHPARLAYCKAAREASDSLSMTRMLSDRPDLVERLKAAYMATAPGSGAAR